MLQVRKGIDILDLSSWVVIGTDRECSTTGPASR